MKTSLILFLAMISACLGRELGAQESEPSAKPEQPVTVRRFFDRPIDYWGRGLGFEAESKGSGKDEKRPEAGPAGTSPPNDWGQMVTLPDGTLSYRELPRPLVRLLENPTPENIRAYFEFRMSRTQKILRAAELIKEYRGALPGAPQESGAAGLPGASAPTKVAGEPVPGPLPAAAVGKPAKATPFTLKYFHKKQCPHCDHQDLILAEWLRDKPEGKLDVIEFGTNPELWRAFQVRGTPTLLMEDSLTRQTVFLEGLQRADALDRKLRECRSGIRREASLKGDEPR